MKNYIKYGIGFGLISAIIGYLSTYQYLGSGISFFIILISFFIACVLLGKELKKDNGGYASFGELVKSYMIMVVVSLLISIPVSVVLLSIMDDATKETIIDQQVENQISIMESLGADESIIADMEDELEDKVLDSLNPATFALYSLLGGIMYILLALIPAAIMKKNESFD